MDKDYLVTRSNHFIMNSSYDLSLEEQKIILTLASMVQPSDEEFKPYKFRIAEFMKLVGVEDKSKYIEIPKITKELMKKVFEIQEGNTIIQTAWLSGTRYEKGSGMVTLKFNPDLKPYMLQLNNMFTQYKLANILSMKSKYSPRIYEVLKCNEFKKQGYIEIEVEELRRLLRADNVYPLYADFKRYVLLQTQKELKKLTDIDFEFEEIKTGRKVTSLKFIINSNPINRKTDHKKTHELPADQGAADELAVAAEDQMDYGQNILVNQVKLFLDGKLTDRQIVTLLKDSNDDVALICEKIELAKTQNVDDLMGWLRSAIHGDYKPSISQKKHGKPMPGDASKRQYSKEEIEDIERKLLGRA